MANASAREQDVFGKQLKQKKKGRFWKGLGLTTLVVVGVGAGLANFTQPGRDATEVISKYAGPMIAIRQNPDLIFDNIGQDHVNILLIGADRNWKVGKVLDPTTGKMRPYQVIDNDVRPRSDTIIICSLDKASRKMRLVSFPRDTRVRYRDAEGVKHPAGRGNFVKLNSLYAEPDGDTLLPKVIRDEFGIRIDRVAKIKLDGFTKIIDSVGGIQVNVEGALFNGKRTRMKYEDKWGGWSVDLMPGLQTLNGEQAHGYVRYRKDNESDPGRVRRQQQVMRVLAKKMMNVPIYQLPGMVAEIEKLFVTTMTPEETVSAAKFAHGLGDMSKITPITPFGIYEGTDIVLNKPDNLKLFTTVFGSSFDPTHFLELSPETKRDDIGARNNNNPAALAVLKEAGLMKTEDPASHNAEIEAPGLQ